MATLRDVAREAGVSVATASRAINGLGNVTAPTRAAVMAAVKKLNFVPHSGARSLTRRKTDTVGVILPDLFGEFFSEIIRGIDLVAHESGMHLLLGNMHGSTHETAAAIAAMRGRVDGLLVMRLAMVDVLGTMSRLWTRFASGVQSVWEKTQNFLAKRFTELFGLFDDSLDVDAAKAQLDAQSRAKLESLARETEDALKRISEEQDQRTKGLLDDAADKMEERRKALEEAKRKLDEAVDDARRKREEIENDESVSPSLVDRFRELEADLSSVGKGIARRVEARGTFNALAVQGLASGNDAIDRTARASEQTARNTRRLVEQSQRSGLTFG